MLENECEDPLDLLKRFVEIESFSHDLDGIVAMAKELEKVFSPYASEMNHLITEDGTSHLKMTFGEGTRQILLLTHLDTVHPKTTLKRMPWKVENGLAFGPGVLDIKASYVIIYKMLKYVQSDFPNDDWKIVWLNTGDEEIGSPSAKEFVIEEAKKSEAVLVLEPALSNGALKTARKAVGNYTITVRGRSAHAGVNPEDGINAINGIAKLVELIANQQNLKEGTTVTVGTIAGGTLINVVPNLATAEVDIRVRTIKEKERIETFFKALKPVSDGVTLEVSGGIARPLFLRTEGTAWLYSIAEQCAAKLNIKLEEAETGGGSDGNFAATTGVPVLDGLGAIGGGAHSPGEYVKIESIEERAILLGEIIKEIAKKLEQ
ncbi:M20 family metallopeptidase [bacterium LRH843]|nr:M20 family metallopeptidase [bacterium LRH843]